MSIFNFICAFTIAACFNAVLSAEDTVEDYKGENNIEKPVGRAYSVSTCDYRTQIGYSCLSCNRALHCYPGNIAIVVDCYGLFRFCRDGRCSRHQGDKCGLENKLTTLGPGSDITLPTSDITANVDPALTAPTIRSLTETVTLPIDPKETTRSDVGSSTVDNNVVNV